MEHPVEPGIIVEPHTHQYEDELSYVVSGTIWARIGDREIEAPPSTYIWKPRGIMHTFWNPAPSRRSSSRPSRQEASSTSSKSSRRCSTTPARPPTMT